MNTIKSDNFIKQWVATPNPLQKFTFESQREFNTSPEALFPLLCPTTELDWLPQWNCELLHSTSGYAELACMFKTYYFGMEEIWVCTRYEINRAIDYTRYSEHNCIRFEILLTDNHDGRVTGLWSVSVSALNEAGNGIIDQMDGARQKLEHAIDALAYYIDKGEIMTATV